ncbi:hypothetical protein OO007_06490 [Cocleimonas sp. KMM 6892]|uniref:hypothetical protein n=1 Tax=unclassified Cocleimonas TaxID=2639732 RepID=UPI002DBEE633|nr:MULTISPECIES: hypothetical protein [unclassified Cocleimonas]MEB8431870.1 hypothetical protein [Cocleimonas sp. KMM 6892]MEC4715044.1 hypothetical protein [Cocleimonas sp. KMM 6895]MEC4744142.1 hypothetical protein [Cocleimonas sp. KMM 6896]
MSHTTVNGITPFLPAKDFDLSLRFYKDLGFVEVAKIDNAVRLDMNGNSFWLQDYYIEEWANNTMLCLYLDDLAAWWENVKPLNITENYEGKAKVFAEPHEQEGGQMMQIGDPAGVLWHIREGS